MLFKTVLTVAVFQVVQAWRERQHWQRGLAVYWWILAQRLDSMSGHLLTLPHNCHTLSYYILSDAVIVIHIQGLWVMSPWSAVINAFTTAHSGRSMRFTHSYQYMKNPLHSIRCC